MQSGDSTDELTLPPDEAGLSPLHPDQVSVFRLRGLIGAVPPAVALLLLDLGPLRGTPLPFGLVTGAYVALALVALLLLPRRRYRAWGYREEADELHVGSGLLVRLRTVVPFGRVQHIDVAQGPVERRYGLATLILHTAGTRGASVALPGLLHAQAEQMRDRIRGKIRQELA